MKKYAISDIHGCNKTFGKLLEQLKLTKADELYLLGDYIDRGPDSRGVIDRIIQMKKDGYQVFTLIGNHEQLLIESIEDPRMKKVWLNNGGKTTLKSFDANDANEVPEKYISFIEDLEFCIETDHYILVHAGLNFKVSQPLEDRNSMLWIRHWHNQIKLNWLNGRIIVHGHTPTVRSQIYEQFLKMNREGYLCIDNGAGMAALGRSGALCAVELTEPKLFFQEYVDKQPNSLFFPF